MSHVPQQRIGPQELFPYSSHDEHFYQLSLIVLLALKLQEFILNSGTNEIVVDPGDYFDGRVRELLIVEVEYFRHVLHFHRAAFDLLLSAVVFDHGDVNLKVQVVFLFSIEPSENVDDVAVGWRVASATASGEDASIR